MGMSIDEIIQGIQIIKAQAEWDYPLDWQIVLDGATETMRKYQEIEEIVKQYKKFGNIDFSMQILSGVVENGNDD